MKKYFISLIFVGFLLTHGVCETEFERWSIDPGIYSDWSGYKTEYVWFDSIEEVKNYLKKGDFCGIPELYKTEEVPLKDNTTEREVIKKYYDKSYGIK